MNDAVRVIGAILNAFTILIFLRAIVSWFPISPRNSLVIFLHQVTEPILAPLRRIIPTIGMMDITPMVAIILLQVIAQVLYATA